MSWDLVREDDDLFYYVEATEKRLGKKTLEMVYNGQHYHLAPYYKEEGEVGLRPSRKNVS